MSREPDCVQLCDSLTVEDGEGTSSIKYLLCFKHWVDPFLILSLILTLNLGDRLHQAQFTEEKTEDQRDEGIVLNPTAELRFSIRVAY